MANRQGSAILLANASRPGTLTIRAGETGMYAKRPTSGRVTAGGLAFVFISSIALFYAIVLWPEPPGPTEEEIARRERTTPVRTVPRPSPQDRRRAEEKRVQGILSESAFAGGISALDLDRESNSLIILLEYDMAQQWERTSCEDQRLNLIALRSQLRTLDRIEVLSPSKRTIGLVRSAFFSDLAFHCG